MRGIPGWGWIVTTAFLTGCGAAAESPADGADPAQDGQGASTPMTGEASSALEHRGGGAGRSGGGPIGGGPVGGGQGHIGGGERGGMPEGGLVGGGERGGRGGFVGGGERGRYGGFEHGGFGEREHHFRGHPHEWHGHQWVNGAWYPAFSPGVLIVHDQGPNACVTYLTDFGIVQDCRQCLVEGGDWDIDDAVCI